MTALIINNNTMATIYILFVLIVALIGLLGVRKENEAQWVAYNKIVEYNGDLLTDNKVLKYENRAYKGANTKHKAAIEELEERIKLCIIQINNAHKQIDESKPMCEKLLTMVKKGNMEEAKAIVKSYYKM